MKLKNLFYLLLAMPLAFAACNETEEPQPQPQPEPEKKPTLTLTSDATMEFEAAGGEGVITYTLENAVEGTNLEATCEADWVLDLTTGETVTFAVAENEAEEARETKVKVAYGELSFEVAVKQEGKKETPKAPVFELVSEEVMEFGQEQALGTIEFNLENPVAGVEVEAKSNAAWVSNVTVKENTIEFVVAANDGAAREAKITATYGMLEFKVTVKQAEYVAPAPVLEITSTPEAFAAEGGEGVIAYVLENAVEGVELQATADVDWITITSAADGVVAFTVAANNTTSMRGGNITLTYGEVTATATIEQYQEGYDPNMNYTVFSVIETWADSKNGGKQWNVTFVEKVELMGECQTVISFYMEEGNAQRIVDGTYSVANGGILVNSASQNGYSTYRGNTSESMDITDAEFTVSVDTEAKQITINGTFQAATNIVTLNYTGSIRGMDLTESTGAANHVTEWTSFTGKYWNGYNSDSEFMFQGVSADGSVEVMFDCYSYPKVTDKIAPEGEYIIAPWEAKQNYVEGDKFVMDQSTITLNTIKANLKSGTLTVEHISGGYKVSFNFVDTLDREVSGVFEGTLTGGTMNQPE
ncbi:MAG: BACON domain-containing protein [Alistipes sp.]|nr:BACON domain-containing protein [Alistipes sp.]